NCRGNESILKLGITKNMFSIYAFLLGSVLLYVVLIVPLFHSMFAVSDLTLLNFLQITLLAFVPTLIIQIIKYIKYNK
ncbi:MAG: cation transporting ATPase C-terminal domain-containing protein, partial [Cetobacterium sp.]